MNEVNKNLVASRARVPTGLHSLQNSDIGNRSFHVGRHKLSDGSTTKRKPIAQPKPVEADIVGNSIALKQMLSQVEIVAKTPVSVLVHGESGVGKEGVARAIHNQSDRAEGPLVKVNCASVPKELFESEFFGHVKGSFTGAHKDRVGRLALADGGTVFLDEVAEIPIELQAKLLRALQEHEFEPVGDHNTVRVDVRIVAATNKELERAVTEGEFREDLYYRLSVFPIEVPPLRKRAEDITLLAQHFLNEACRQLGRERMFLLEHHIVVLQDHSWPGNVRELKNVIERAVILSPDDRLRLDLAMEFNGAPTIESALPRDGGYVTDDEFKQFEKANIHAALRAADWKIDGVKGAAALLGLKPSTLRYRIAKLGIVKV